MDVIDRHIALERASWRMPPPAETTQKQTFVRGDRYTDSGHPFTMRSARRHRSP